MTWLAQMYRSEKLTNNSKKFCTSTTLSHQETRIAMAQQGQDRNPSRNADGEEDLSNTTAPGTSEEAIVEQDGEGPAAGSVVPAPSLVDLVFSAYRQRHNQGNPAAVRAQQQRSQTDRRTRLMAVLTEAIEVANSAMEEG